MSWYKRNLNIVATYWAVSSKSVRGAPTFSDPVEIDCYWESDNVLFVDNSGIERLSKAIVMVDEDLDLEGYLYLGISTASDPRSVGGAYAIKRFEKTPSIRGNGWVRTAYLF